MWTDGRNGALVYWLEFRHDWNAPAERHVLCKAQAECLVAYRGVCCWLFVVGSRHDSASGACPSLDGGVSDN